MGDKIIWWGSIPIFQGECSTGQRPGLERVTGEDGLLPAKEERLHGMTVKERREE